MAKTILSDEIEELSCLLDEINTGQDPQSGSPENQELLATAKWIKEAGLTPAPPRQLIEATVDKVLADIKKQPVRRKHPWLYSGALGTAAAVLLVIGLNTSLLSPKQPANLVLPPVEIIQSSPQTTAPAQEETPVAAKEAPQTSPAESSSPAPMPSLAAAPEKPSQPMQSIAAAPSESVSQKITPDTKTVPSEPDKKRTPYLAARKVAISETQPKEQQPSAASLMKSLAPQLTPLSLPGKQPDTVTIDEASGTVTQIYAKGTPDELVLIQEPLPADTQTAAGKTAVADTPSPNRQTKAANQAELHQVSTTLDGQKITIKGRQSEQELLKLTESLK